LIPVEGRIAKKGGNKNDLALVGMEQFRRRIEVEYALGDKIVGCFASTLEFLWRIHF
jgi:hypothetical protein